MADIKSIGGNRIVPEAVEDGAIDTDAIENKAVTGDKLGVPYLRFVAEGSDRRLVIHYDEQE